MLARHRARGRAGASSTRSASPTGCGACGRRRSARPTAPSSSACSRFFLRTVRDPPPSELAILERARDLAALAIDRDARTQELGRLALHDTLTGPPQPRARAGPSGARARAARPDRRRRRMVAVLFVDLDRFKLVNDGLGHDTGDELLVAVSRRLAQRRPPPGHHRPHRRRRVRRALRGPARRGPGGRAGRARRAGVRRTVRAVTRRGHGVGEHRHRGHRPLVRPRRRTSCRTPTRRCTGPSDAAARATSCSTRRCTRRPCRACSPSGRCAAPLDRDELRVLFQPAVRPRHRRARSRSRRCCAGSTRCAGSWCPATSSRVAEETGIIVPMGEWVLGTGVRGRARRTARRRRSIRSTVSINVSARQLQRPDFPELVARTARDAGRRPRRRCASRSPRARCSTTSTPRPTRSAR